MKVNASYHQERLWFIDRFEAGSLYKSNTVYHNIPIILDIEGPINVGILERSIREVVNRHEALRTKILTEDNLPVQDITDTVEFQLNTLDISNGKSNANDEDRYEQALYLAVEDSKKPFSLDKDLLIRGTLILIEDQKFLLVLTLHHIISDRYSLGIIAREISTYYKALCHDKAPRLPDLPLHYVDFSQWQRELPQDFNESLLSYWKRKLRGRLQPLELPTDFPRSAIHTFQEGRHYFNLGETLAYQIKSMANQEKTTNFIILLAAFKILLSRYSGLKEIIVGTSVTNRSQPGTERIVGPLANLLVLRSYISRIATFSDITADLNKTVNDAFNYADLPFDKLVSELNPDIDMSRTALFDVLFQYEETPQRITGLDNLQVTVIETNLGWGKYDLNVFIQTRQESFTGILVYNRDYYNYSTISRLICHYQLILESISRYPTREISRLSFLTEQEKQQLLVEWNQTRANYPKNKTLQQLFEKQVKIFPHHTAVVYEDTELTYAELHREASRLANDLRKHYHIQPGDLVGVLLDRSPWMIIGLLSILKSGGAYVPMDPAYPAERMNYILKDSGCKLLITSGNQYNKIEEKFNSLVVDILSNREPGPDRCKNFADIGNVNSPADTAYVIYTSGTTGYPKGCMVSHRNVVRLLINDKLPFEFNEHDVWIMAHSYCFDFSVWEMYGALLLGGQLVVPTRTTVQDIKSFCSTIKRCSVTVLNQTPAAFYNLIEEEKKSTQQGLDKHLRYVCFGGDKLELHYLREWLDMYPLEKIQLVNMFGITETTVHVTYYRLKGEDILSSHQTSPIGRPLPETTLYLFDTDLNLLPVGVLGQFFVGGTGAAKGYLNKPALTMDLFIENPYKKGEIIYRTGDLGRWLADGCAEYLGRIDHQVKIRGYRIELGEIEAHLMKIEKINKALVISTEDRDKDRCLIVYFIAEEEITNNEIRSHLKEFLPDYMIPRYFIKMDRFPLTATGKIDKQSLPSPGIIKGTDAVYEAPGNEIQTVLVKIWQEVLRAQKIGIHDNFFILGGDSLKGIRVINKIQEKLGESVHIALLFQYPTIKEFCEKIKGSPKVVNIEPIPKAEYYQLSSAQKRLWILDRMEENPFVYNISNTYVFDEELDRQILEMTFKALIKRHESLRTVFIPVKGEPKQKILDDESLDFKIQYLDIRKEKEPDIQARWMANEEVQKPFNLEKGPLLRAKLIYINEKKYLLLLTMHHIISDGWSMDILVNEALTLYNAYKQGKEDPLPLFRLQYKDYAAWQNQLVQSEKYKKQEEYWLNRFKDDIPILDLPTDYERPALLSFEGSVMNFEIHKKLTAALKNFGLEAKVTLNMLLMAAYYVLLEKYTSQEDIIIGTPIAGRQHPDLQGIIGFFVNMLAIRNQPQGNKTFNEFLQEVKENAISAYENQDYQFDELVSRLGLKREPGRHPLLETIFVLQTFNEPDQAEIDPGKEGSKQEQDLFAITFRASRVDLTFMGAEIHDSIIMRVEYSTTLFKESTIEDLSKCYLNILEQVVENNNIRLKEIRSTHDFLLASPGILQEENTGFDF